MTDELATSADDAYMKSTFYEQLVEHVFISEVLQEVWYYYGKTVEVLRSEVDASGYDVVLECNEVLRHVQLKTSRRESKTARQKVNIALAAKPSGCIVWIVRSEDIESCRASLSYLFFGGESRMPLPSLEGFKVATHTKGNAEGVKKERAAIRVIPKAKFTPIATTRELVSVLFGLHRRANPSDIEQITTHECEYEA
ncbi:MAG: hypothetical protein NTW52_00565 [Planctomycetota bacterium]|nr:hypothetical protein [Planctomycetota bacterium]